MIDVGEIQATLVRQFSGPEAAPAERNSASLLKDTLLLQNWAQLKNNYGAVWEGSCPSVPPLDIQLISGGQTLVLT